MAALLVEHSLGSVIRGHHIYKATWLPYVGETLLVEREEGNVHDSYAVSIKKDDSVVGHVPREILRICWHFIGHGGTIGCEVTGHRKKGKGLEVPCKYSFTGQKKIMTKLKRVISS